jgi:hypothetical protein
MAFDARCGDRASVELGDAPRDGEAASTWQNTESKPPGVARG